MKKILLFILTLVLVVTLASCDAIVNNSTTITNATTTTTTQAEEPNENPKEDYAYTSFTASEKSTMMELWGEVIPFIKNNEYYFENYTYDYDEGITEIGVYFCTVGNTQTEFNDYRVAYSEYTYKGSETDEYGDMWFSYVAPDGSYYIDMAYYLHENDYMVVVYAYILSESDDNGDNGGSTSDYTYTEFTASDKDILAKVVGSTNIPFLANNEYYLEEETYNLINGKTELSVNFYTYGNTKDEFDAYKLLFSDYTYKGTDNDDYGDTWYYYTSPDGSFSVDIAYYEGKKGNVVDVYFYCIIETENPGGNGSSSTTDVDLITNAGAGLPTDDDGVFDVDFTKAEPIKDVTDQGYYIDGSPTMGSPAVLVIPVQFSDVTAASKGYSTDVLVEAFAQGGDVDYYSVYDYYYISSYGQLTLDITVLDFWFTPEQDSKYYYNAKYNVDGEEIDIGDQLVLDEALAFLADIMDLSQFDSDDNGVIDSVVLINTLDIDEGDFYWAYCYMNIYTDDDGEYYKYDDVYAKDYIWASYKFLLETEDENDEIIYDSNVRNTYTYIHEFAHVLGLDDYYDTSYTNNELLLDGSDIMSSMPGDHNAYSKFNLGWLTTSRLVVTDSSVTLTLEDFSKNGDTIIIANNWDEKLGAYQEYYILAYYTNNGLNAGDKYGYFGRDGVVVYHVNASLYIEEYKGEIYYNVYNNNTDSSDSNGTEDNLIEFIKSGEDTFTYIVGSTFTTVVDDNGDVLIYTFTVDALTSEYATVTITKR